MALVSDRSLIGAVRLSAAVHVALREGGVSLPKHADEERVDLGLPGLSLLEALAAGVDGEVADVVQDVAARSGGGAEELDALVAALERRRMLVPAEVAGRHAPSTEAVGPATTAEELELDGEDRLFARTPLVLRVDARGFTAYDHDGAPVATLDARQLCAAAAFRVPRTLDEGETEAAEALGSAGPDRPRFRALVADLLARGILRRDDGSLAATALRERSGNDLRRAIRRQWYLRAQVDRQLAALDEAEAEREDRTGVVRTRVVPIHNHGVHVPLGLGMILAYAGVHDEGRLLERYQLRPDWTAANRPASELAPAPGVFLFSNYIWSIDANLARSAAIKAHSPGSVTIHGGPETPKYDGDVEAFFAANPHVDVAIHGEGEVTTAEVLGALADVIGSEPLDLSALAEVPGLSYRDGDRVVRTGDRERLADLNVIPSPFLSGLFDAYGGMPGLNVTLETNRGCPYGCTFCDWGTVTMARIRKFDLDRVMAELDWCATHEALTIGLADANFGIFERDVDIAQHMVELNGEHGFPRGVGASYAKNTIKHLEKIVTKWVDAGIATIGVLSLQTMDPGTLTAVKRSNIKTEKYDELARQFRKRNLPLYIDLMMALPGSTLASFADDLQGCIDRDVQAKLHSTVVLVNSPMNDPAYRAEYGIEVRGQDEGDGPDGARPVGSRGLVATSSMSRAEYADMFRVRSLYLICENFGVLRHVARYVRHETGEREIDLYLRMREAALAEPWRWPALDFLVNSVDQLMASPASWQLLLDEVRDFILSTTAVPDDSALATVLEVQHAVLPAPGRSFPVELDMEHDVVAWHQQMLEAKDLSLDWTAEVPHLRDLPPARMVVQDPRHIGDSLLGGNLDSAMLESWELDSPIARPLPAIEGLVD